MKTDGLARAFGIDLVRVDQRGDVIPLDEYEEIIGDRFARSRRIVGPCWEYTGFRIPAGYGQVSYARRKILLHRLVLQLFLGRPPTTQALHYCDNPPCFRPWHLHEGTMRDNMAERDERGRAAVGARHARSRLTPEQVRDIVARARPGQNRWNRGNLAGLAAEHGVSKQTIHEIVTRGHWSLREEISPPDLAERYARLLAIDMRPDVAHRVARARQARLELAPGVFVEVAA